MSKTDRFPPIKSQEEIDAESKPRGILEVIGDRLPRRLRDELVRLGVLEVTMVQNKGTHVTRKNLKLAKAPSESKPVVDWRDL